MTSLNPLHCVIQHATGAPVGDLALIENIMRDDIFHSTLDWQTRGQLIAAAREAFALLQANRDLYESHAADIQAAFQSMHAASQ